MWSAEFHLIGVRSLVYKLPSNSLSDNKFFYQDAAKEAFLCPRIKKSM